MKLHEAILKGCKSLDQGFEYLFQRDEYNTVHACALGAAIYGVFGSYNMPNRHMEQLVMMYPILDTGPYVCPDCTFSYGDLCRTIVHLNDGEHWSRERIAEFVKNIEVGQGARIVEEHAILAV